LEAGEGNFDRWAMRISTRGSNRRGVAAVEFAVVLPLLMLLLIGIWELGRIIQVQMILNNAARDGARLGAQANIVTSSGAYTQIQYSSGTPNIVGAIQAYLTAAGITNQTGLVIQFQFIDPGSGGGSPPASTTADPYTGIKNQRFMVSVTIPYANVRWTTLSLINPTNLTATTYWECLVDDPFTVNTTLPGWSP
jgi:Flp pilus assembly protein TadG